ncbi:hypothetical protein TAMA11512_11020 [Selenomonas sp. TAMA-11512]|nr:hypothetical protein TAMA11512_11020 [Selenomonas sp. TAMA-11512]
MMLYSGDFTQYIFHVYGLQRIKSLRKVRQRKYAQQTLDAVRRTDSSDDDALIF